MRERERDQCFCGTDMSSTKKTFHCYQGSLRLSWWRLWWLKWAWHVLTLTPPEKSHEYYSIYVPFLNTLPDIGKKILKKVVSPVIEKQPWYIKIKGGKALRFMPLTSYHSNITSFLSFYIIQVVSLLVTIHCTLEFNSKK